MKTNDQLNVQLQGQILQLGQTLSARTSRHSSQGRSVNPDALASEVERVLKLVRASPARKIFGIRQGFVDANDPVHLKAIALLGWKMIGEACSCNQVDEVVRAIVDDSKEPYCEQMLLVRDCLARMVCDGLLLIVANMGHLWDGRLVLPKNTFSWMTGGKQSRGDFDFNKIVLARLQRDLAQDDQDDATSRAKIPTAKQLYEKVRQDVVGIDPQVKVLASRFALHVARADALKAGLNADSLSQMVVCLVASSGASKSYLASKMSEASGLPQVQVDSTTLTASGYVGSDIDDIYKMLTSAAGGDAAAASRGVCFLDEFDKKSTRYGSGGLNSRDVGGEAIQMELLAKLQATATPFLVGGKKANDCRQFLFDGRPTGYILAGVFAGLDDAIDKLAGRNGIGFASESGNRHHASVQDALKELGFIDELVNRIGLVLRLPDPTIENIMLATANGILNGFNQVLGTKGIVLYPKAAAVRAIGKHSMESKAFYRGAKAILAAISAELLFDPRKGTVVIDASDVRRTIDRLSSGFIQPDDAQYSVASAVAMPDADLDAQPEAVVAGG